MMEYIEDSNSIQNIDLVLIYSDKSLKVVGTQEIADKFNNDLSHYGQQSILDSLRDNSTQIKHGYMSINNTNYYSQIDFRLFNILKEKYHVTQLLPE